MAAWNFVLTGYRKNLNPDAHISRAPMLAALAPCFDPKDALEHWNLFIQEAQVKNEDRGLPLASLSALADRLDRDDVAVAWEHLVGAGLSYKITTSQLTKLAERMAPSDAPTAVRVALDTMDSESGSILAIVMGLGAMGNKLNPVDARAAGGMLLRNFENYPPIPAGAAVSAIKGQLDPTDLRSAGKILLKAMAGEAPYKQPFASDLIAIATSVEALQEHLDPSDLQLVGKRMVEGMDGQQLYPDPRKKIVEFLANHPDWLEPSDVYAAVAWLARLANEKKRGSLADLKILVDALPDKTVAAILAKLIGAPVGKRPASLCRAVPAFVREGKPQTVKLVVEDVLKWPTCHPETRAEILKALASLEGIEPAVISRTSDEEEFELDRWKFARWSKPGFDISTMPTVARDEIP